MKIKEEVMESRNIISSTGEREMRASNRTTHTMHKLGNDVAPAVIFIDHELAVH